MKKKHIYGLTLSTGFPLTALLIRLINMNPYAGGLTILGVASNIIFIDVAESKNVKAFTFVV